MSFPGPSVPGPFLRLLRRIGEGTPDRALLSEILDEVIEAAGAERGFVFLLRPGGGFRVLIARHRDREAIPEPVGRISHYAVRRALELGAAYLVQDARRDRRYRTEESVRTGRQPVSILVLPLGIRGKTQAGIYLDRRFGTLFGTLPAPGTPPESVEQWRALLEIGLQARERERLLTRSRLLGGIPRAAPSPAPAARALPEMPAAVVEFHGLIGSSPDMLDLFDTARRLGGSDLPVVLCGETGTGKELLAKAIHLSSRRAERPFLALTCGAVPDTLLESELFGHARGAFTGAEAEKKGLLFLADGGTLLLDEVGDMSPEMQQKLLRVLEDGRVRPLGQKTITRVDVRILSSTHRDLEKLVEGGRFRNDLYYRLRGTVLTVPPLRERREEILVLCERFLERFARAEGREPPSLGEAARRRLISHTWPGNVRELENEMRRLTGLEVPLIEERHLSPFVSRRDGGAVLPGWGSPGPTISQVVSEAEREAIRKALARSAGNKSRAALLLGITRKALYRRLARYRM